MPTPDAPTPHDLTLENIRCVADYSDDACGCEHRGGRWFMCAYHEGYDDGVDGRDHGTSAWSPDASAEQLMGREPDLRAAAAQLRQLDRIKAAYEAVKDEHLASVRPFRADCGNAKCAHLIACLIDELDALEDPDADT